MNNSAYVGKKGNSSVEQPVPCSCDNELSFISLPSKFINVKHPELFS